MNKNKEILKVSFALIIIAILCFVFYKNTISSFPSNIHAWSQSDRYALALGFTDNGMDFFHPETYNLNPQFPSKETLIIEKGITSVDFPIHEYIIAAIMKITGNFSPLIFRLHLLLYSIIGLLFIYKLTLSITKSNILGYFSIVFVFTAPVFTYYQDGFIPSIPSLANTFISFYFYYKYLNSNNKRHFYISIAFLTLAALTRTTFSIFLIAIVCNETLKYIKSKNIDYKEVITLLISFSFIISYYLYNLSLRSQYGSIFLSSILPPDSISDFIYIIKHIYQIWFYQYFTYYHYIIFLLLTAVLLFIYIFKNGTFNSQQRHIIRFIFIGFFGAFLFFILIAQQFINHDYYFLDTFFPLSILLFIILLNFFKFLPNKLKLYTYTPIVILSILLAVKSYEIQETRLIKNHYNRVDNTIDNFKGADKFLSSINIPLSSKILVIDSYTPNIPFILMKRKGYSVLSTSEELIKKSLSWNYDYIVIQNQFLFSDVIKNHPEIVNKIHKIANNRRISVYKLNNIDKICSISDFMGYSNKTASFTDIFTFEDDLYTDNNISHSGEKSYFISSNNEFSPTIKTTNNKLNSQNISIITSECYIQSGLELNNLLFVISIVSSEDNKTFFYNSFDVKEFIVPEGDWFKFSIVSFLPNNLPTNYKLKAYLWNSGKNNFYMDDFNISIY